MLYRSIGNGFNRCAWRIHDIKGGLLPLSIHYAHLSNYTMEVAQVCLLQPVICMTGTFSSQSYMYIWPAARPVAETWCRNTAFINIKSVPYGQKTGHGSLMDYFPHIYHGITNINTHIGGGTFFRRGRRHRSYV